MARDGTLDTVTKWLVIIGGLNWGLRGLGGFMGGADKLDVIKLVLGKIAVVESLVYLLVGLSALYMLWGMFKK